ncbi:MAG: arginine--tRNA ligase [Ilumatobacteraceae bacterium]
MEIAGPGFLNLTLTEEFLCAAQVAAAAADDPRSPADAVASHRRHRYSAPNVAKEMHVGHLHSTIIGDCPQRAPLRRFLGDTVVKENYIGDWGTPFGMLIEHLLDLGEDGGQRARGQRSGHLLQGGPSEVRCQRGVQERSRRRVVALGGDEETLRIWRCSSSSPPTTSIGPTSNSVCC